MAVDAITVKTLVGEDGGRMRYTLDPCRDPATFWDIEALSGKEFLSVGPPGA
ncbi:MAG: hypothetical protein ACJA2W_002982 [Planctomycetota bacterium]